MNEHIFELLKSKAPRPPGGVAPRVRLVGRISAGFSMSLSRMIDCCFKDPKFSQKSCSQDAAAKMYGAEYRRCFTKRMGFLHERLPAVFGDQRNNLW